MKVTKEQLEKFVKEHDLPGKADVLWKDLPKFYREDQTLMQMSRWCWFNNKIKLTETSKHTQAFYGFVSGLSAVGLEQTEMQGVK